MYLTSRHYLFNQLILQSKEQSTLSDTFFASKYHIRFLVYRMRTV